MSQTVMAVLGNKEARIRRFGLVLALLTALYVGAIIAFIIIY